MVKALCHQQRIVFFCQKNRENELKGATADTLLFGVNKLPHPVVYLGWPKTLFERALARLWFPLFGFLLALRNRNADLFIIQDAFVHLGLLRALRLIPPVAYINIHFSSRYKSTNTVHRWLLRLAATAMDLTVLLRKDYPPFGDSFSGKTVFIPLGVDVDYFTPSRRKPEKFILSAGRADRDHEAVLDVARRSGLPFILVIGRKQSVSSVPRNVRILKEIPLKDLRELYRRCRASLMLFKHESFSNSYGGQTALLELLALDKPVVISQQGWLKDYGLDRNPNVTVVRNAAEAFVALKRIKTRKSRAVVVKSFSTYAFAQRLHKSIHELLGK